MALQYFNGENICIWFEHFCEWFKRCENWVKRNILLSVMKYQFPFFCGGGGSEWSLSNKQIEQK